MGSEEKSQVTKTADEIRRDLRRRFGPAGLDPDKPEVELEIELVAQVARVAQALENMNAFAVAKVFAEYGGLEAIVAFQKGEE